MVDSKISNSIDDAKYILATDVGSTTTKARYFEKMGDTYRYVVSGEAPTTVEAPYEDVTMGVRNAVREVEEMTGRSLLDEGGIISPRRGEAGVDIYVTTSSAGGGLQMVVGGLVKAMTAESAERAALGAGAIVMDIMSVNDPRPLYQKIRRIRTLRPDMILLAGGTDGGDVVHVVELAELVNAAEPKARLGAMYELPIVFAGNKDARVDIRNLLGENYALKIVDNLRPTLEIENTEPARRALHELFMEHVMSHAPGYDNLMKWTAVDIMPTPAAEGMMMQLIAKSFDKNVIGVGLGGATTNIYSVVRIFERDGSSEVRFVRTVSANLGMSYSISNVLKESGIDNIRRWLIFDLEESVISGRLRNKMIRPTTIPQTQEDLMIEHAVAREALRLGLGHHRSLARGLKGVKKERDVGDFFLEMEEESYINMMNLDIIAGTGGLLSHAPNRSQTMLILTDAFLPEGITLLCQDSVFMMPHLGVLSTVHEKAAWEIFDHDCLVRLGSVIAPKGTTTEGEQVMNVTLEMSDGVTINESLKFGNLMKIPLAERQSAKATIIPNKKFDIGAGPGNSLTAEIEGGVVGIMIDARGRPLQIPEDSQARRNKLLEWYLAMEAYPKDILDDFMEM
jgi:uncharacterized protein (TIGR01319 family)